MYLTLCLPTVWLASYPSRSFRNVRQWCLGFGVAGLVASYSRGAWLGLAVGGHWVGLYRHGKLAAFLSSKRFLIFPSLRGGCSCGCSALFPIFCAFALGALRTPRTLRWPPRDILTQHPWVGLGPGNYASAYRILSSWRIPLPLYTGSFL